MTADDKEVRTQEPERDGTGTRAMPRAFSRTSRVVLGLLVTSWLSLAAWLVIAGPTAFALRDTALYLAVMFGAACAITARALRYRKDREVWIALALAVTCSAAGDVAFTTLSDQALDTFPNLSDALYVGYYPFAIFAVMRFAQQRVSKVPASLWLDALVLALALAGLTGAVFIAPLTANLGGGVLDVFVGAAYPVGDTAVLMVAGLGITLVGVGRARVLWWLVASVSVSAMADLVYWNQLSLDTYVEGTWIDALWPLSSVLLAIAAWIPQRERAYVPGGPVRGLMAVPGASLVLATATLVYGTSRNIPVIAVGLAVAALLGVLSRVQSTMRATVEMVQVRHEAMTDDVTGLLNRRGLSVRAQELMDATFERQGLCFLVADVNGFKLVNDSLGHLVGDQVLRDVGMRIASAFSDDDAVVACLGGDKFAVVVPGGSPVNALAAAQRLTEVVSTPLVAEGVAAMLDVSIGIALGPRDGVEVKDLMRRADIAMFRAKTKGSKVAIFDAREDESGEARLQRVAELRTALDNHELAVYFQPKVSLSTGAVVGLEALVRWVHPQRGLVLPGEFLDDARVAGLMEPLTFEVLSQVLDYLKRRQLQGQSLPIAVNLPVAVLSHRYLPVWLESELEGRGLAGSALEVEITEEALLQDSEDTRLVLSGLKALGISIALDDYGTGYSSLTYLKEQVVDVVKIDRSFVAQIDVNGRSRAIVGSTIDLAHRLGLTVVAEGIETEHIAAALLALECDQAQGFFWAPPLPPAELESWLASRKTFS